MISILSVLEAAHFDNGQSSPCTVRAADAAVQAAPARQRSEMMRSGPRVRHAFATISVAYRIASPKKLDAWRTPAPSPAAIPRFTTEHACVPTAPHSKAPKRPKAGPNLCVTSNDVERQAP